MGLPCKIVSVLRHRFGNIKSLAPTVLFGESLEPGMDRSRLESVVKGKLADYGIDAKNFYIDWDLKTIIVLCRHITERMKIFMSKDSMSLGGFVRDLMVTAHRVKIGGQEFGLVVIYCKKCLDGGLKMMLGEA